MEPANLGLLISLVMEMYFWKPKSVVGKNQSKPCGFPTGYDYKKGLNYYNPEGKKSAEFIILIKYIL